MSNFNPHSKVCESPLSNLPSSTPHNLACKYNAIHLASF